MLAGVKIENMSFEIKDTDLHNLHRRYESGESIHQLAAVVGVSDGALKWGFQRLGLEIRTQRDALIAAGQRRRGVPVPARRKITDDQANELFLRYQAGESSVDLARELGVSNLTVRKLFRRP